MEIVLTIIFSVIIIAIVFFLIVIIPVVVGKLLFRWSGRRMRYVISESMSSIVAAVVGSLLLTGLVLLVGMVFKQEWAFAGGMLIIYTFWIAIKAVKEKIRNSRGM